MVEILLATYNGEKYLREQLYSIFAQSCDDFCILARDDGSKDGTVDILNEFAGKFPNKMKIIHTETATHSAKDNFIELINHASAEYVMLCDQDDFWKPDKISVSLKAMRLNDDGEPLLLHSDLEVADEELNGISPSYNEMMGLNAGYITLEKLLTYNCVTGCTIMMNKALYEMIKYPPSRMIMHDWWIALCAEVFGRILYLDETTVLYRQHKDNVVGARKKDMIYVAENAEMLRNRIFASYEQAEAFLEFYRGKIPRSKFNIIRGYAILAQMNKFERAVNLLRYGYTKSTAEKTIGQIFFC